MGSEGKAMMILNKLNNFSASRALALATACVIFAACATPEDPLDNLVEVKSTTLFDAPPVRPATPASQEAVAHGKYLVELLGCGACHTDGALMGDPNMQAWLAGSSVGIAYSNPLAGSHPGVVFPPNITPDVETGIGGWSRDQVAAAIRAGAGRHGGGAILVMPWQAYAKLSDEDVYAMADYLKSIEPVRLATPENVPPGQQTSHDYVHFGVYWTR
jgi:mono/diheme cytochrome c family protein